MSTAAAAYRGAGKGETILDPPQRARLGSQGKLSIRPAKIYLHGRSLETP